MSNALELLRVNDPQRTWIEIPLNSTVSYEDAAIAQALEQNQYITRVELQLTDATSSWENLYRVLATRGNLVRLALLGGVHRSLLRIPMERIRPILQAIQQNASVRVVEFCHTTWEAQDLCSFLDAAGHVADLTLEHCDLTGGEQEVRDVTAALQRNTSVVRLKLLRLDVPFLGTILDGLDLNSSVRSLDVQPVSLAAANVLQRFLESSTVSIQHFELQSAAVFVKERFRPVAQGLINARTVTDITFSFCNFYLEECIRPLNDILGRKHNLRALTIDSCPSIYTKLPQFLPNLCSALCRPASPLRHFHLHDDMLAQNILNQNLVSLLEAIAESKLESVHIGRFNIQRHFTAVANFISSVKIRELVIRFEGAEPHERDNMKPILRQAVKNNFTLQSANFQVGNDDLFDASDQHGTLQFYLDRNTRLAQWVENPAAVPKHLWKEALQLATKAGPETLFRLLRKIGPEVLPVSRKRKRSSG